MTLNIALAQQVLAVISNDIAHKARKPGGVVRWKEKSSRVPRR